MNMINLIVQKKGVFENKRRTRENRAPLSVT